VFEEVGCGVGGGGGGTCESETRDGCGRIHV
jgi:hypothetical protein